MPFPAIMAALFKIGKLGVKVVKGIKERKQRKADKKKGEPIKWSSSDNPTDLKEVIIKSKKEPFVDLNDFVTLPNINVKPDQQSSNMMKTIAIGGAALFVAMLIMFGVKKK